MQDDKSKKGEVPHLPADDEAEIRDDAEIRDQAAGSARPAGPGPASDSEGEDPSGEDPNGEHPNGAPPADGDPSADGDDPAGGDDPADGDQQDYGDDLDDFDPASLGLPGPGIVVGGEDSLALTVDERLPSTVFVFPLRKSVAFPNLMMPVLLDDEASRSVVKKAEAGDGHLLLLTQKDEEEDRPGPDGFHQVGVLCRILKTLKLPDGNASVMVQGRARAKVQKFVRTRQPLLARVAELPDVPTPGKRTEAVFRKLREALEKVADASDQLGNDFRTAVLNIDEPSQLADFVGAYLLKKTAQRQVVLETAEVGPRLEKTLQFVLGELELAELGNRIQAEIREKVEKAQKEYFLREQIKLIRRELGEEVDAREAELQRFEEAVAAAGMPEEARAKADEELQKLRTTPVESAEYSVLRNYLDWLTALPWAKISDDTEDLAFAAQVLDEDHYGLDEVKQRILEFLAVRKLKPEQSGSILCLSGPPGVGKTSLGRSIARAMGREFWRFSLGGMRDEAEIKGHRRTYIGALPGRIIQGLKTCGTRNPVLMLDEIDKLGSDFRGDPSSALLEVLDPEQNHAFLDHYLDVPFDLSRVMFVATANVLPQIPEPLRDRMEVIELPGYLAEEKVQIARRHILPKQLERHGLLKKHVSMTTATIGRIVHLWTREAGVRGLEKQIVRVCRKAAAAVAKGEEPPGRVSREELDELLGPPRYPEDRERKVHVPGVVQGLAWTPVGGDVLYIEAAKIDKGSGLTLTGSLGDVMSESVRIAHNYLRGHCESFGIEPEAFKDVGFHVHFPAGAIPKDGPSAGIAIATALCSLLAGKQAPGDLAMTGELTLVGEVLPIGGVREKVLAAKRLGLKRVILPDGNRRDIEELREDLVKGLRFVFVETFEEVWKEVCGPKRPRTAAAKKVAAKKVAAKQATEMAKASRKRAPGKKAPAKKAPTKGPRRKKSGTGR